MWRAMQNLSHAQRKQHSGLLIIPGSVQPYLDLVKAYGWGNYMFQTNQGNSFPAHQYLFGATSAPSAEDDHKGIFAAESNNGVTGCMAPSTTSVALINPQGLEFAQIYPCFEHLTLADLLDALGVSWRYYGQATGNFIASYAGGKWIAPNAIKHICVPVGQKCTGTEWTRHLEFTSGAVLSDISTNCKLRNVSWVMPDELELGPQLGPQRYRRPVMGGVHRQCRRNQPMQEPRRQLVLEQHGDHSRLGRLGWLV